MKKKYKILAGSSLDMLAFFLILSTKDDAIEGIMIQVEPGEMLIVRTTEDWRDIMTLTEKPTKMEMIDDIFMRGSE